MQLQHLVHDSQAQATVAAGTTYGKRTPEQTFTQLWRDAWAGVTDRHLLLLTHCSYGYSDRPAFRGIAQGVIQQIAQNALYHSQICTNCRKSRSQIRLQGDVARLSCKLELLENVLHQISQEE